MKRFLLLLTIIFTVVNGYSQTAEDSVKATINQLFTGMKNADPALIQNSFGDSAVLQTIVRNKEGVLQVKDESVKDFAASIATLPKDAADERITFDVIKIDGPLAIVWTPYQFYYNGKFSHCGVNSFQLVRFNNGWKIQYLIDTRRKQGCAP